MNKKLIWSGLVLGAVTIVLAWALVTLRAVQAATSEKSLPVYGQIADFTLTNQDGHAVSLADLRGKVWVADIIFTRCAGPCLKMSRQMQELAAALPPGSQTKLISLTTDPEFDTPAVLKKYGERFGEDSSRWQFLTGTKKQIAAVAVGSLKLAAVEKTAEERENPQDLFVHSTIFVIVDKHGQLRGVFQTMGEGLDPQSVKPDILAAARELEREP